MRRGTLRGLEVILMSVITLIAMLTVDPGIASADPAGSIPFKCYPPGFTLTDVASCGSVKLEPSEKVYVNLKSSGGKSVNFYAVNTAPLNPDENPDIQCMQVVPDGQEHPFGFTNTGISPKFYNMTAGVNELVRVEAVGYYTTDVSVTS
jgi:hypothetical protein